MSPTRVSLKGNTNNEIYYTEPLVNAAGVPDDGWIAIFESIDSPAALAALMRTCKRFYTLASNPLLKELKWTEAKSTTKNLDAWNPSDGAYHDLVALPRKVTIGVDFKLVGFTPLFSSPAEHHLHDHIYLQLPRFTSLKELVFENTVLSPHVYAILAQIPTLRTLTISDCSVHPIYTPSSAELLPSSSTHEGSLFENLPITHLSLHRSANLAYADTGKPHPLHLVTAKNLTSLSITWTLAVASLYTERKWVLPKLEILEVVVVFLTRDLSDSLVAFVENCPLCPKIKLTIDDTDLNDQRLEAAAMSLPARHHGKEDGMLTHLAMNDPMDVSRLLDGLVKLPRCVQELEIWVKKWDIEVLFAIRSCFPAIKRLVVRYGGGAFTLDVEFLSTFGPKVLCALQDLHTIKLLHDSACDAKSRQLASSVSIAGISLGRSTGTYSISFGRFNTNSRDMSQVLISTPANNVQPPARGQSDDGGKHLDIKEYLEEWSKYCTSLRVVQLDKASRWKRRFEGDQWSKIKMKEEK
ncbi:hypothetical protein NLJ89_g10258 [Agrocybe chaxingu]|uniref:F-box domain-containing protein n=1 Tax=Agrocybe chaxingu TaxID=84603 RepID=A0A9W8JS33_9AGAR|nr:hypothetical protein NLJ89_g10258 [Agrocybe chaxingu]